MSSKITKVSQLSSDSLTNILQEYFKDSTIRLSDLEGNLTFLKQNDNFNSDVKRWTFNITKGPEGNLTLFRLLVLLILMKYY